MSNNTRKSTLLLVLVALILASCTRCTLPSPGLGKSLTIMSYNVENLFDDRDDGSEYSDYDPGRGTWNSALYHAKLKNIADVVSSVAKNGADICLVQEVENQRAVNDLVEGYLNVLKYRYVVTAPGAGTATTVAALSRFRPTHVLTHRVHASDSLPLRTILELHFDVHGSYLVVLNAHWKSKSGGARETEPYRVAASALVAERVAELRADQPGWTILVAGDLNERADEYSQVTGEYQTALLPLSAGPGVAAPEASLYITDTPELAGISDGLVIFFSPWLVSSADGSYAYRGEWEQIDHFLLMPGDGYSFSEFAVIDTDFLLDRDGYPNRWSTSRATGYSDHLPIVITLER